MKCRVCRDRAVIDVRRHNAAFCRDHFLVHCRDQVRQAIEAYQMVGPGDRVLVAVSGGKDSLALWDLLAELDVEADGVYLGLGIGEYSDESVAYARGFARTHAKLLHEVDLAEDVGFTVPSAAEATQRSPCGACGLSKRHLLDRFAIDHGYDVVATGHNLDDEAAVLLGNVLRWETEYLARQHPVLPAASGFPRKVKPLLRVGERETAAYCVLRGIEYQLEECPMADGNRHLGYKEMLNRVEQRSPGTKAAFLFGFLERGRERFADRVAAERAGLSPCSSCGAPTPGPICAFCRLRARAARTEPVDPPARRS